MTVRDVTQTLTQLCGTAGRGQLVAKVCRRFGFDHIDLVQDALQEAYIKALEQWAYNDMPDDPEAWLLRVAGNYIIDRLRRDQRWSKIAGRMTVTDLNHDEPPVSSGILAGIEDDQLAMIYACSHPTLPQTSQVAICLKAVFGLTTEEIATTYLLSPATLGQRVSRAKKALVHETEELENPSPSTYAERTPVVLNVLYLVFTNGYFCLTSDTSLRTDLCRAAVDLTKRLCAHPTFSSPSSYALLALMLFHGARLEARQSVEHNIIELPSQDRTLWDSQMIREGVLALRSAAQGETLTNYHLEAEIASIHATTPTMESTDWQRILDCYDLLVQRTDSPVVKINRVVAVWKLCGTDQALRELDELRLDPKLVRYFPMYLLLAELYAETGRYEPALESLRLAEKLTPSVALRDHLARKKRTILKHRNRNSG